MWAFKPLQFLPEERIGTKGPSEVNKNASHRADSAVVCAFVSLEPNSQVIVCRVEISCGTPSLIKSCVKTSSFEKKTFLMHLKMSYLACFLVITAHLLLNR